MITDTGVCGGVQVDLIVRVENALGELPERGGQEVMEKIAGVLVRPEVWTTPGRWEAAVGFGLRSWVVFVAMRTGPACLTSGGWGENGEAARGVSPVAGGSCRCGAEVKVGGGL
ncbi:hypothetical protein [Streptomyces sp. NPDC057301]|uniref:hypothetical protein n=1 Tax=Streptomyces sp. NPDC057301 TaxID=3346093 RepID=UPI00363396CE